MVDDANDVTDKTQTPAEESVSTSTKEPKKELEEAKAPAPEPKKERAPMASEERVGEGALSKRARIFFGSAFLLTSILIALALFAGLPTRYAPVDVGGGALLALLFAAGAALVSNAKFAPGLARVASFVTLALGMLVVILLASSAGYLSGAYGAVGQGGAVIFIFVIALIVPYLIALPSACLVWLGPRAKSA